MVFTYQFKYLLLSPVHYEIFQFISRKLNIIYKTHFCVPDVI
jgi:hypothetical protein